MPKNDTHFFTIAYKLQEFMGCPLTDPITANMTSCVWVAKVPSTWKSHLSTDPSVLGTGSCSRNVGKFGGVLNFLGVVILF